ncbi:SCO4225 family membrane protein [Streptomyces albus]|uniref:SCO4225 family membrane protein n=1 Tax=Streptomyces TaxID=1883 RepID=UPI00034E6CDE|nr:MULTISPECIES: hypothetical protein [Streptomyces]EPD95261.1 hypothetical protein HMPREF1486_02044 [Streptomyces sp. HPH0547]QID36309.1 hypothetical protein G3260_002448 [Streptomyces albus]GHJ21921.1 hypothetical protein TPA0909_35350 [Streptomyces albus]
MAGFRHQGMTARALWLNPASLTYLAVVVATVLFTAGDVLLNTSPDASLAGVWMFFATAPLSPVLLPLVPDSSWLAFVVVAAAALVQAAVIGAVYHAIRGRLRPAGGPAA